MEPKYILFDDRLRGKHLKIRLRDKAEMFSEAEAWVEANSEALVAEHGHAYFYLEVDTGLHIAGISHNSCARGWPILFGPPPFLGWNILGVQL